MKYILTAVTLLFTLAAAGQDRVRYTDDKLVNADYLDGRLTPVVGVHNIQVLRANRENPDQADGLGWTYNHAPMLAYWNGMFYLSYLGNPIGEHMMPGATLLCTSKDGYNWSFPKVVFPVYKLPVGMENTNPKYPGKFTEGMTSVMHQRMGFYVSKSGKLLTLGYYGICITPADPPNEGHGVGRVVREVKADGTEGPIYFIRYNKPFGPKNTNYPFYKESKDKAFVAACDELLANRLMTQQWEEETDDDDPVVALHNAGKAFAFYHLDDGRVVGMWKTALSAISSDEGATWSKVAKAPGFVNRNAKIWGQKTSDGKFAMVYNPSMFRWPLAVSTSADGLNFKNLWLIHGEGEAMRYGGHYKDYGPQYMRGIAEGNGVVPGGDLWMTYSYAKEDIWISKIPVPLHVDVKGPVNEDFDRMPAGHELDQWNIYSPVWARTGIEVHGGIRRLTLRDKDPYNYAKAIRAFPDAAVVEAEFTLTPVQSERILYIEMQDDKGTATMRFIAEKGVFKVQASGKTTKVDSYQDGKSYRIRMRLDCPKMRFTLSINGKEYSTQACLVPIHKAHMLVLRTGTAAVMQNYTYDDNRPDLPNAGTPEKEAVWAVSQVQITPQ